MSYSFGCPCILAQSLAVNLAIAVFHGLCIAIVAWGLLGNMRTPMGRCLLGLLTVSVAIAVMVLGVSSGLTLAQGLRSRNLPALAVGLGHLCLAWLVLKVIQKSSLAFVRRCK